MACPENAQAISAYHDGELSADDSARLELHLAQCELCKLELEHLRGFSAQMSAFQPPRISPGAMERVKGAFDPRRDRMVLRVSQALTAAAAGVLIVCSVMLWQRQGPGPSGDVGWESAATTTVPERTSDWSSQAVEGETDIDVQLAWSMLDNGSSESGYENE